MQEEKKKKMNRKRKQRRRRRRRMRRRSIRKIQWSRLTLRRERRCLTYWIKAKGDLRSGWFMVDCRDHKGLRESCGVVRVSR